MVKLSKKCVKKRKLSKRKNKLKGKKNSQMKGGEGTHHLPVDDTAPLKLRHAWEDNNTKKVVSKNSIHLDFLHFKDPIEFINNKLDFFDKNIFGEENNTNLENLYENFFNTNRKKDIKTLPDVGSAGGGGSRFLIGGMDPTEPLPINVDEKFINLNITEERERYRYYYIFLIIKIYFLYMFLKDAANFYHLSSELYYYFKSLEIYSDNEITFYNLFFKGDIISSLSFTNLIDPSKTPPFIISCVRSAYFTNGLISDIASNDLSSIAMASITFNPLVIGTVAFSFGSTLFNAYKSLIINLMASFFFFKLKIKATNFI